MALGNLEMECVACLVGLTHMGTLIVTCEQDLLEVFLQLTIDRHACLVVQKLAYDTQIVWRLALT